MDPMDDKRGLREAFCDLSQARIAPYKNTWKHLQKTVFAVIYYPLKKGLRFYQTRSNVVVIYDTLPAEFIEKAVCMQTGEQLYQRENERPRVALKAISQCESQDLPCQEKQDHLGKHKAKCEASGRPDATSWTTQSQACLSQRFKSKMNKNYKKSPSWSAEDQQVQWSIARVAERHESNRNLRALREH